MAAVFDGPVELDGAAVFDGPVDLDWALDREAVDQAPRNPFDA